jgi:branched-chain amino acid transport system ATP-binding protein
VSAPPLLEAEHLRLSFGGVRAVDDVSLSVSTGEMLAIIGQNGAGKSTFLNICTGHLRPERGEVRFAGRNIIGYKPRAVARMGIARSFQHPQIFFRQSVSDNLRFALAAGHSAFWHPLRALACARPQADVAALLELCDLGAVASLPARAVPEGARKLLDVAMALALSPRLLLLDEPTSGVGSSEKLSLMTRLVAALTARSVTAVFVEHDMEVVARFAKRVAVWAEGRLFRVGPPEEILADPEVRARVL